MSHQRKLRSGKSRDIQYIYGLIILIGLFTQVLSGKGQTFRRTVQINLDLSVLPLQETRLRHVDRKRDILVQITGCTQQLSHSGSLITQHKSYRLPGGD